MTDDLTVQGLRVLDEARYTRENTLVRERVYRFWLGSHGPFVERVPLEPFDPNEIQRRVDAVRAHLQSGPR